LIVMQINEASAYGAHLWGWARLSSFCKERNTMRFNQGTILVLVASFCALVSTSYTSAQTSIYKATLAEENAKSPEISTEQMRHILTDGKAVVLDTRSRAEFEAGHIPGASVLDAAPTERIAAVDRLVGGDKNRALVLYCNGPFCQASRRLGEQLAAAGFTNVRRYQLGIPIWRALGGPVVIELGGIKRVVEGDQTAVFVDARSAEEFAKGSLPQAINGPVEEVVSGKLQKIDLPEDDFNRRVVLFGGDGAQARRLAEFMSKRPWHNVAYFPGTFEELSAALNPKH
jgi:rhodanese-related sulfurtransferase